MNRQRIVHVIDNKFNILGMMAETVLINGIELYVGQFKKKYWTVTEPDTGARIATAATREDVMEEALQKISSISNERWRKAKKQTEKRLIENGIPVPLNGR
jgi:hypothetical protein